MTAPAQKPSPPALPLLLTEPLRAANQYALFVVSKPLLNRLPRGDGHPVLVLPGLTADDGSTRPLRVLLERLGYETYGWELGRNVGPTRAVVDGLDRRLTDLRDEHGRPVSLVGWSLGGIFARGLARRSPDAVRQVITMGSPFRMQHGAQSRAHSTYQRFSHLHARQLPLPLEDEERPLPVPSTSIYSRLDGIVHWSTCIDTPGEQHENIAVRASHLGLGHHPAVVWAVADRLAQPEGSWRPFNPPAALRGAYPTPPEYRATTKNS